MDIILEKVGKRYNRSWIFRELDFVFRQGSQYAILGPNGSGKSTVLQTIAGYITPTRGKVSYNAGGKIIPVDSIYKHISMAAPYMELPEELTLSELLSFHSKFKEPLLSTQAIMHRISLEKERDKEVRFFSSGMRQRVKLALAILFQSDIIMLDEPSSHLDKDSTQWYRGLVQEYSANRLLLISSNQPEEYDFCDNRISIEDYKKASSK